mmetsp:Transcript_168847/g.542686  ORF Transcript_168847/g.542686 Transcript_168847/m.542686 type:complete len:230 (+) Transcript_168847:209-898(+)
MPAGTGERHVFFTTMSFGTPAVEDEAASAASKMSRAETAGRERSCPSHCRDLEGAVETLSRSLDERSWAISRTSFPRRPRATPGTRAPPSPPPLPAPLLALPPPERSIPSAVARPGSTQGVVGLPFREAGRRSRSATAMAARSMSLSPDLEFGLSCAPRPQPTALTMTSWPPTIASGAPPVLRCRNSRGDGGGAANADDEDDLSAPLWADCCSGMAGPLTSSLGNGCLK